MFSCRIKLDIENELDSDQCEKMAKEIANVIYQSFEYIESVKMRAKE